MADPIEVQLVDDVRQCRACKWFWGDTPPYDPYTAYDFETPFPPELLNRRERPTGPRPWLTARAAGAALVAPSIMRGCRKAPIMTIGINPNLEAFWPDAESATWAYPQFSDSASYAYYHRHRATEQECVDLEILRRNLVPGGKQIVARHPGWVTRVDRCNSHRWAQVTVTYADPPERRERDIFEVDWTPEHRFVFVVPVTRNIDDTRPTLTAGQIIGGEYRAPDAGELRLLESGVGYYERFLPVFDRLRVVRPELADLDLRLAEDVCQHDNVHCPSAGWVRYDVPTDCVVHNCVEDQGHLVAQIVQSRPAVIMLVSRSSSNMFRGVFRRHISVPEGVDASFWRGDVYSMMATMAERRFVLSIAKGPVVFESRLLVVPHFSYAENFVAHSRFSICDWERFCEEHPTDRDLLRERSRIARETYDGRIRPIRFKAKDELVASLSPPAVAALLERHYDPYALMTKVLVDELDAGRLGIDAKAGHLARTAGPCHFCDNERWSFPEKCPYGKTDESPVPAAELHEVIKAILSS